MGRCMCNGRGTYPQASDVAQMNIHQASYLVSIHLSLLLILVSLVQCVEMRIQSPTCI